MSRRRRDRGGPSDDVVLEALDRWVEQEGIVEAGEQLGVNCRTAATCHDSRRVGWRMREPLRKYLREQEGEREYPSVRDWPKGEEENRPQQPDHGIRETEDS